jgi:hypothetical protein
VRWAVGAGWALGLTGTLTDRFWAYP